MDKYHTFKFDFIWQVSEKVGSFQTFFLLSILFKIADFYRSLVHNFRVYKPIVAAFNLF